MDCIVDRETISPVYANLIAISLLPLILIALSFIVWVGIITFSKTLSWTEGFYRMEGTMINLLFLVHPSILKTTLQMFACTNIEGVWYMDIYMADVCWEGDHYFYGLNISIPALIVWGIGLPLFAFIRLRTLNRDGEQSITRYGFLYLGYRDSKWWWEFIVLGRKFAILIVLIWISQISVFIQALTAIFILYASHSLQIQNNPFASFETNRIENISLVCSQLIIYLGQWYLSGELGEETKIMLFTIILIATAVFIANWIWAYLNHSKLTKHHI